MSDERPINLSVLKYRFPATAVASVLHRIAGFVLFLFIPFILCVLDCSLHSAKDFSAIQKWFSTCWGWLLTWVFISALLYHFIAGIRHLLMDIGFFESKHSGRIGAYVVMGIAIILIVCAGVWLW